MLATSVERETRFISFNISLLKELIFKPSQYFRRVSQGQISFKFPFFIYAVSVVGGGAFYCWKPQGFPRDSFSSDLGVHSFGFWLGVGVLGFFLTIAVAGLVWIFLRFLEKRSAITLKNVVLITFSSHVYYILLFGFLLAATVVQAESFYKISEIVWSLASFVFTLAAIRAVSEVSVGKIFLSLFTASMAGAAILYAMYLVGILPAELLKALLFS